MDGFDLGNMMGMLGGLQQKIQQMQAEAATTRCEGSAGGGLVRVVCTGDQNILEVHIKPEATEDPEMLEDLVRAATNEALRNAKQTMMDAMKQAAGGLPIPPGMIPGL